MSQQTNTNLLERAAEMINYWEGTIIARTLEEDLKRNDLDALHYHVREAEDDANRAEECEGSDDY